jgi:hypothetical protein
MLCIVWLELMISLESSKGVTDQCRELVMDDDDSGTAVSGLVTVILLQ